MLVGTTCNEAWRKNRWKQLSEAFLCGSQSQTVLKQLSDVGRCPKLKDFLVVEIIRIYHISYGGQSKSPEQFGSIMDDTGHPNLLIQTNFTSIICTPSQFIFCNRNIHCCHFVCNFILCMVPVLFDVSFKSNHSTIFSFPKVGRYHVSIQREKARTLSL
jgi:hypothetical protein